MSRRCARAVEGRAIGAVEKRRSGALLSLRGFASATLRMLTNGATLAQSVDAPKPDAPPQTDAPPASHPPAPRRRLHPELALDVNRTTWTEFFAPTGRRPAAQAARRGSEGSLRALPAPSRGRRTSRWQDCLVTCDASTIRLSRSTALTSSALKQ